MRKLMIRTFEDLEVYKNSKNLYPQLVKMTEHFPRQGWHLRDQVCRSANAIHADIAEGFGRSIAEFKNYLTRALGSCNETKSHLEDAMAVGWLNQPAGKDFTERYVVVGKQLYRLRESWH